MIACAWKCSIIPWALQSPQNGPLYICYHMRFWLPRGNSCDLRFLTLFSWEISHVTFRKFNTAISNQQFSPGECAIIVSIENQTSDNAVYITASTAELQTMNYNKFCNKWIVIINGFYLYEEVSVMVSRFTCMCKSWSYTIAAMIVVKCSCSFVALCITNQQQPFPRSNCTSRVGAVNYTIEVIQL